MTKDRLGNPTGRGQRFMGPFANFRFFNGERKFEVRENSRGKPTVIPYDHWDKRAINQMPINVAPRKNVRCACPKPAGKRNQLSDKDAAQNKRIGACRNRKSRATFLRTCAWRRKAYLQLPLRKAALGVRKATAPANARRKQRAMAPAFPARAFRQVRYTGLAKYCSRP